MGILEPVGDNIEEEDEFDWQEKETQKRGKEGNDSSNDDNEL